MRPLVTSVALLALTSVASAEPPAEAPFRTGTPPVLSAPKKEAPDPARQLEDFRAAYEKAGRPSMALYWNRELSDDPNTTYEARASLTAATAAAGRDEIHGTANGAVVERTGAAATTITATAGEHRVDAEASRAAPPERVDWDVESAFKSRLIQAGVKLVDRNVALRTTAAAGSAEQRRDVKTLEMAALTGKADILLEVLQTPDASTPTGYRYRIEAKRLSDGAVLASVVGDGRVTSTSPGRFVAGRNGFERETPAEPTHAQRGEELAAMTLAALTRTWR